MTVHALVSQCALSVLSCLECKIAKIFWGFAPGSHWGGLAAPSRLPNCTTVFLLATLVEKRAPPKNCWIRHCNLWDAILEFFISWKNHVTFLRYLIFYISNHSINVESYVCTRDGVHFEIYLLNPKSFSPEAWLDDRYSHE